MDFSFHGSNSLCLKFGVTPSLTDFPALSISMSHLRNAFAPLRVENSEGKARETQGEKGAAEASVKLTIIIPTWNRKDLLRNCLKSLSRQASPSQVLVVNNGVADLSGETIAPIARTVAGIKTRGSGMTVLPPGRGLTRDSSQECLARLPEIGSRTLEWA